MTFVNAIKTCFLKYVEGSGRATRSEYWYFVLFYSLLSICMDVVDATIVGEKLWSYEGFFGPAQLIFTLLIILPSISVTVRRLHDINKSGWWWLISFTVIGLIPLTYWVCKESDNDENTYGNITDNSDGVFKEVPKWIKIFLIPFVSVFFIGGAILLFLIDAKILLDPIIHNGTDLSDSHKIKLINSGIINESEEIQLFYSPNFYKITEDGQLITNNNLVTYQTIEGLIKKYKMRLENIKAVELKDEGTKYSDSRYKIIGNENAAYEFIEIYLTIEDGRDQEFIKKLKSKIK